MNVVAAAVGSVVPKLLQVLEDEYKLQRSVKKNVESLSKEMKAAHNFLCKVSEVPWDQLDEQVKEWASAIREKSYDMEDILDTFLVRVEGREPPGRSRLKVTMNKMVDVFRKGKARHDVGSAIKDIMEQLQEVAARRDRYRIEDLAMNSAPTRDPRLAAMYKEVASLVGIEKPSNDLIAKLELSSREERKIVSISGPGGLGKTTLAKSVYDKLKLDFKCGAFVSVGRNPNLSRLLMDILYELDKNIFQDIHTKNRDERQLIDLLREFLIDKRYFIVIDDIWETTSWEDTINLALLQNNHGSRILITTRNSQVAKKIGDEVYRMQTLSHENSRKLFYIRIFGTKEKWLDSEPDEIPNKILKKCDGLPLAIITMASLLAGKPRERWSDIFFSLGFGHMDDKQVGNATKILSFSYYDMPAYLRTCLLYLSIFPEDHLIEKDSLIWMWIAEGFVQGKQRMSLFEVGEQYFNDLVNRSMVQAVDYKGTVISCRVHDMVLDFICSISFKENFVTILDNFGEGIASPPSRSVRRLALHNIMDCNAHSNTLDIPHVRLLFLSTSNFGNWDPLSSCKFLRVLNLQDCEDLRSHHLVHLGNLLHLRYLSLKGCWDVDELPDDIAALKHLKVLDLDGSGITDFTSSISKITQLVCLKGDYKIWAPEWIGKLVFLEELKVGINCSNKVRCFLKELGSLQELRVFKVAASGLDENMLQDFALSVRNLHKLQILKLFGDFDTCASTFLREGDFLFQPQLRVLHLDIRFPCLPPCIAMACLSNLIQLTLNVDHMDQKGMEFLGRLPELYYLELKMRATTTVINIGVSNGFFQKLRFCIMYESMIQLQCNEGDSSISFHIWNGEGVMPFGSSKNNSSFTPYTVMPNLEELKCKFFVRGFNGRNGDCSNVIGLEYLPSLQWVRCKIDCEDASAAKVAEVEAALRKATQVHSNRPTLVVYIRNKEKMISAVQDQMPEDDADVLEEEGDQKLQLTPDEDATK